jgi:translation initiation factor 2 subunit 1
MLKNDGFKGDWINEFKTLANENISIQFVEITGYLEIKSWLPDGINHIRDILINAEQSEFEDVDIQIKYIGAPQYIITVKAPDYKIAEDEMKKAVENIEEKIKEYNGEFKFHRKAEE